MAELACDRGATQMNSYLSQSAKQCVYFRNEPTKQIYTDTGKTKRLLKTVYRCTAWNWAYYNAAYRWT